MLVFRIMSTYFKGFRCFRCATEQTRDYTGYECPVCGSNIEVIYDWPTIPGSWVDGRRHDIFRYSYFLPVADLDKASPLRVGMTPLYAAPRLGEAVGLPHVYIKDDGQNPSASFKDRAGAVALVRAREVGASVICGASTGNAGSSMACLSASVGMPCVIFVPETAPAAKIAQLLIFGATVLAVRGSYDDAFDLCMATCREKGWFNRNTGYNPFTREGKKTAAYEIYEQLGEIPDWVAVSTGDGNILSGIWKGFRDLRDAGITDRTPKMLCTQSTQSNAIAQATEKFEAGGYGSDWTKVKIDAVNATTVADSISVDVPRDGLAAVRAVVESGGAAVAVPDESILAAISELARGAGVFSEPAASCAWAGVKQAAAQGLIRPDEKVVCMSTGNGLKDVASARNVAGEPISISTDLSDSLKAVEAIG